MLFNLKCFQSPLLKEHQEKPREIDNWAPTFCALLSENVGDVRDNINLMEFSINKILGFFWYLPKSAKQ